MGDTTAQQNALLGTWGNMRRAVTATYTVASADKGWTVACGGGASYTVTLNAASGYDANFQVVILNEDASNNKTIAITGGDTFPIAPNESILLYVQNSMWRILAGGSISYWAPVFSCQTTGNLSVSYGSQFGYYTKIGRLVNANFVIIAGVTWTTASGYCYIAGLPITASSTAGNAWAAMIYSGINKTSYAQVSGVLQPGSSSIVLYASGMGQAVAQVNIADIPSGGTLNIQGSITYFA